MAKDPVYGTSFHYQDEEGEQYFQWQNRRGSIDGKIEARKFAKFNFEESIVLDFGAGGGNLLANLDARVKIAVEINESAHQQLHRIGASVHHSIESVSDKSVDVVISHHSLEHVPYPIEALKQMKRVLKDDGILLLWIPIDDWREQKRFEKSQINHHLQTWTPQLIGNSLTEAGFNVDKLKIDIVTHAWFPGYFWFYRFPGFDALCRVFGFIRKRRQIRIVARMF